MKYFFLVCHRPLGSSLQKCVEFSIGKPIEEIINIEITPNESLFEIQNVIEKLGTNVENRKKFLSSQI